MCLWSTTEIELDSVEAFKIFLMYDGNLHSPFSSAFRGDRPYKTNELIRNAWKDGFYSLKNWEDGIKAIKEGRTVWNFYPDITQSQYRRNDDNHLNLILLPVTLKNIYLHGYLEASSQDDDDMRSYESYQSYGIIVHDNDENRKRFYEAMGLPTPEQVINELCGIK